MLVASRVARPGPQGHGAMSRSQTGSWTLPLDPRKKLAIARAELCAWNATIAALPPSPCDVLALAASELGGPGAVEVPYVEAGKEKGPEGPDLMRNDGEIYSISPICDCR